MDRAIGGAPGLQRRPPQLQARRPGVRRCHQAPALGRQYDVDRLYSYEEYESCLREVDAVFIALPNSLHREYTERAAAAGVHVLCEKPMAMTEKDCEAMIESCRRAGVRLMLAYRLHFEKANLRAVEMVQAGELGEPRLFGSVFSRTWRPATSASRGGGWPALRHRHLLRERRPLPLPSRAGDRPCRTRATPQRAASWTARDDDRGAPLP